MMNSMSNNGCEIYKINGEEIPYKYYESNPLNPTVVFFPGTIMRLSTWSFIYSDDRYNNRYNFLFFEHKGQINASKYKCDEEQYSVEENCEHLHSLLKFLGLLEKKLHLVGISGGGALLFHFALCHSSAVKSVFLCSPFFLTYDYGLFKKYDSYRNLCSIKELEDHRDLFFDLNFYDYFSENSDKNKIIITHATALKLFEEDDKISFSLIKVIGSLVDYVKYAEQNLSRFAELPFPKKVVAGELDRIVSPNLLRKFADNIMAEYQCVEGVGHVGFLEETDLFNSTVFNFISMCEEPERELRSEERISVNIPAEIVNKDSIFRGDIRNISSNGVSIEIPKCSFDATGERIKIRYRVRDDIEVLASLKWIKKSSSNIKLGFNFK